MQLTKSVDHMIRLRISDQFGTKSSPSDPTSLKPQSATGNYVVPNALRHMENLRGVTPDRCKHLLEVG